MTSRLTRISLALALCTAAIPVFAQSQSVKKVAPDRVPVYWTLTNSHVDVDVPNTGKNLDQPGCAAVTYTIGADGVTRDLVAVRVVPEGDLGIPAVSAVKNFHYAPAANNRLGNPIATYYVVEFNMPADQAKRAEILKKCVVPGYAQAS
ncbi:TonB-like protein [Luteibacter rhizovicinus]|uniref:TonB-like protein n=1 Tax=Luteibacter rhizovicinus TaxID=242606 RepID=A0A4R3YTN3_9GAMM|nr:energy transducer TonB [Luteibacter rhizovicinus]TCV95792.1 TonB-like protein [Luteibacter rhizovicinus]